MKNSEDEPAAAAVIRPTKFASNQMKLSNYKDLWTKKIPWLTGVSLIRGFKGYRISLTWNSGLGILKQNHNDEIWDWKYAREVGCQKQPSGLHEILRRDYGIEEPYWVSSTEFILFLNMGFMQT